MKHGFVPARHGRIHYLEAGQGPALALCVNEVNRLSDAAARK